ncbi:hypothetical protein D9M72_555890 [compost metagenome]
MRGRDRCHRQEFEREVAVGHGVDRVAGRAGEAERLGGHVPVDRETGAGECGSTNRAFVHMLDGMAHARTVAAEHFHVGHAMVAEGDRLRGLQVCEARHDGIGMFLGTVEEGGDQRRQRLLGALQLFLDPEAEVERHLVVARAGGVQASGRGTDQRRKPRFDVHVDVFEAARELELAAFDL